MPTKMLDYIRYSLYAMLIVISMFLYQAWEKEHPQVVTDVLQNTSAVSQNYIPDVPKNLVVTKTETTPLVETNSVSNQPTIRVKTDLLDVQIDMLGGNVIGVELPQYQEQLNSNNPFVLLNNQQDT